MSAPHAPQSNVAPPAPRWRLWIDGCGGYLLLPGTSWTLGGLSARPIADVRVRADWPRVAGRIERQASDYFWCDLSSALPTAPKRTLITPGQVLPVAGSARMQLRQPNPLVATAVLELAPPHRFDEHVDGVVLLDQTLLIGPYQECHLRCEAPAGETIPERFLLTYRDGRWQAGVAGHLGPLVVGRTTQLQSITMTLEQL